MKINKLIISFCLFICYDLPSQSTVLKYASDSINKIVSKKIKKTAHSPQKAAIFSAILPGLGQGYNQKYWKIPIVYAGLGGFTYLYFNENNRYQEAKMAYLSYVDNIAGNEIELNGTKNAELIRSTKNVYRNQRDMYMIIGILFYGLNIVDAAVDAHLFNFDVSDDLSLNWNLDLKPGIQAQPIPSLCFQLNLKK